METLTYNNGNTNINGNNSRPHPTKSRSNNFSHAAVNKSDVGDFQAGYFVMADMPYQPQPKPKNHNNNRTIERHSSEKRNHRPPQQPLPPRARSANDLDSHPRESDSNVSQGRLTTSPHRSPTRTNKRNSHSPPQPSHHSQSTHLDSNTLPMSPHKPRKAHENVSQTHVESGSPPKGPSPTPNRWAGPAFSNAPPPSSLPLPDFPPFAPSSVSSSPPSSSPPQSASTNSSTLPFLAPPPVTYQEPLFFNQPPVPLYPYPHFNAHFSFAEASPAHHHGSSLAQLSTDLRRMLNISSEPVHA